MSSIAEIANTLKSSIHIGRKCLYRVSQKKRNSGFSVPCELKELCFLTSLDKAYSAEENDTKIIKFGWVILNLCPLLEIKAVVKRLTEPKPTV